LVQIRILCLILSWFDWSLSHDLLYGMRGQVGMYHSLSKVWQVEPLDWSDLSLGFWESIMWTVVVWDNIWEVCVWYHLVERRAGSKAVGGGGGPLRSSSSTYPMRSLCLSSDIQSRTRYLLSFSKIFSMSDKCCSDSCINLCDLKTKWKTLKLKCQNSNHSTCWGDYCVNECFKLLLEPDRVYLWNSHRQGNIQNHIK